MDLITELRAAMDKQQARADMWADTGDTAGEGAAGDELRRMVAAHRKILDLHVATDTAEVFGEVSTITYCPICRDDGECPTLEALAEGYGIEP